MSIGLLVAGVSAAPGCSADASSSAAATKKIEQRYEWESSGNSGRRGPSCAYCGSGDLPGCYNTCVTPVGSGGSCSTDPCASNGRCIDAFTCDPYGSEVTGACAAGSGSCTASTKPDCSAYQPSGCQPDFKVAGHAVCVGTTWHCEATDGGVDYCNAMGAPCGEAGSAGGSCDAVPPLDCVPGWSCFIIAGVGHCTDECGAHPACWFVSDVEKGTCH